MHDHHHHHHHDDRPDHQRLVEELDPASRSLAEALRVSFRLLSVSMLLLATAYVFSGMTCVSPTEQAVVSRFGQLVVEQDNDGNIVGGVRGAGLLRSWPYPIDRVIRIPTSRQITRVKTFWFREIPGTETKALSELPVLGETLAPGWDGALMTGGRGLMHVMWDVEYAIPPADSQAHLQQVLQFARNVTEMAEAQRLVRTAVENASVSVAANYSVDQIYTSATGQFVADVQRAAQAELDALEAGINLTGLTIPENGKTVPLQTLKAFTRVIQASQERDTAISQANKQATERLINAAGSEYPTLQQAISRYDRAQRDADQAGEALKAAPTAAGENYQRALRKLDETRRIGRERIFLEAQKEADSLLAAELQNKFLPAYDEAAMFAPATAPAARQALLQAAGRRSPVYEALMNEYAQAVAAARQTLDQARGELVAAGLAEPDVLAHEQAALKAGSLYGRVNELLVSGQTAGEAATLISQARTYSEEIRRDAEMQWVRFNQLRTEYQKNPELLVNWLWTQTQQEVLSQSTAIKDYTTPGVRKVVTLGVDPRIVQEIQRLMYERTEQAVQQQRERQ